MIKVFFKKEEQMEKRIVICQKWEESERGWGTRPDGYSLHLTEKDRQDFCKEYWDKMPKSVPDEYSREDGTAYSCEISEKIYQQVVKGSHGIWCFGSPPIGVNGKRGSGGWR